MRISDWSSDVCSSDLVSRYGGRSACATLRRYFSFSCGPTCIERIDQGFRDRMIGARVLPGDQLPIDDHVRLEVDGDRLDLAAGGGQGMRHVEIQIGRAHF